jgi:hypothetical protein
MSTAPFSTNPDVLLTEVQSAEFLSLSTRTLQAWRSSGGGPLYVRAGRAIRYRHRDLLSWVESNTIANKASPVVGR